MGKRWSRGTSFLLPYPYFFDSIVPDLESSLSLALRQFYPLAGKICHPLDKYEIHYADGGDSVPFTVAEYEADFDDISGTHARDINVLRPLVPQLPKSDDGRVPLLALQVTVFPNQGAATGVAVHHAACDGLSSTRFMSCWASTREVQRLGGGRSVAARLRQEYDCKIPLRPSLISCGYKLWLQVFESINCISSCTFDEISS